MQLKNTDKGFGIISILLHWIIAILIIALIIMGLYMVRMPINPLKLKLFRWHKEIGMLVLILAIMRISWRFFNVAPSLWALPILERIAARSVHWIFYFFMFFLPISGWFLSSASAIPVSFFGWFVFPDFISASESIRILLTSIHDWLGYILIAVLCLHISASLKHHFINKDDILRRMLWP